MTGHIFIDYMIHNFFVVGAIVSFWQLWKFFYWSIFWKDIVKRKDINKMIESVIKKDQEILDNPTAFPSSKQSAVSRINQTLHLQNLIERL